MKTRLAVIADDLTGANDAGVQYAKQGLRTVILTKLGYLDRVTEEAPVIVVDTESRVDPPEIAYSKVAEAVKVLQKMRIDIIYKKVDSTLRGNIGAELDAIMDVSKTNTTVVVPAFPANGRITIGGYHLVNQVPVASTEVSKDPLTPVRESHVPTMLMAQTKRPVVHIPISTVMNPGGLEAELKRVRDEKGGIAVIDAVTQSDLKTIAMVVRRVGLEKLVCGSAGLAEEMPSALGLVTGKPALLVSGSVSEVTMKQIRRIDEAMGVSPIKLDVKQVLMKGKNREEEIARILGNVRAQIAEGKDCIVSSAISREDIEDDLKLGRSLGLSNAEMSREIVSVFGEIVSKASSVALSGIILTGGTVSMGVLTAIDACGIKPNEEVMRGIPMGQIMGGPFNGLRVVTKAGAFGSEDALIVCLEHLRRRTQYET